MPVDAKVQNKSLNSVRKYPTGSQYSSPKKKKDRRYKLSVTLHSKLQFDVVQVRNIFDIPEVKCLMLALSTNTPKKGKKR